jgi:peptidoglycan biosynthesis protein MviN/MurJ (putative lipid II flippase)
MVLFVVMRLTPGPIISPIVPGQLRRENARFKPTSSQLEAIMDTPVTNHNIQPRSELQPLLRLALPILITQLAQMGTILVDTLMAGRVSAVELAGVALGSAFMFPVAMTMMGLIQAVTPTVSQLRGAGRSHEVGEVVRQAFWIALLGAVVTIALMLRAGILAPSLGAYRVCWDTSFCGLCAMVSVLHVRPCSSPSRRWR